MAAVGAELWPHSHSEMSERIRRYDWGATALDAPDTWPAALRLLLDTILEAPLPMCILWGDQALQLYNDAHAALIGDRHPGELGQPACHRWGATWELLDPACDTARRGEPRVLRNQQLAIERQGELVEAWFDLALSPIRDEPHHIGGLLLCLSETSERVRTETRLSQTALHYKLSAEVHRASEQRLQLALEASDLVGFWDWAIQANEIPAGVELSRILPVEQSGPNGLSCEAFFDHVHADDAPRLRAALQRCIAERGTLDERYRLRSDDGDTRWALARGRCHCDEQGRPLRFPGAVMNITGQQASEDALRQSEAELKTVTDALPVLIGYIDAEERFRFNNRYYTEWFGHSTDWLLGKTAHEVLGERGYAERQASIRAALAGQEVTFEAYSPHRDGEPRRMLVHYLPRRDCNGAVLGFFVMALDVTERWRAEQALRELNETLESRIQERTQALAEVYERLLKEMASREQAQEALRQAQKMEAVGQLTGGIAHDFNNMLTGIIGGLDLIQRYIQSGRHGETQRFIDAAVTSANRAAALTHRLLAFARRQPLNLKRVELNHLIESMHDLLSRTLGNHIQIGNRLQSDLWPVSSDENQLESALLNLVINARDAMADGGTLLLETRNIELYRQGEVGDLAAGRYVILCLTDSGCGMSAKVLASVFEPFFTTKPIGQGTGLGLSMVYGFTRQAGGHIQIVSEPGSGTQVSLYLPVFVDQGVVAAPTSEVDGPLRAQQGETVLVVEDDPAVRLLVIDVLEMLGYQALEAADGNAAIRLLESTDAIDMLVTDVGLPGMNGRQLADVARQHHPRLPVLFMTGYAKQAASSDFLEPGMDMISKPFNLDALAKRVRDMLAETDKR
ncbi:PAS domain-containing protein [Pseudomonas stutzeri]|uniref:histidine kinase n=1 Tax=Stutzerimonas stutzeri TaxID=316 RepID=A0A2N8RYQ7_STUST|nr:PAS domain-containing protein [Stutzerimonas stutzeri]MCQ4295914.1 PAS domain-containing protein [Stutzerimonas stutzeri]PNF79486.1 hybrid sensor histidine kinase/response regulator [Stutzerimonas stutzeri]